MEKIGFALLIATIAILGRCASLKHNLVGNGHAKHATAHGGAKKQRSFPESLGRIDRYSFSSPTNTVTPAQTSTPEASPEKKTEPVTSSPTPTPPTKPPKERPKEPF